MIGPLAQMVILVAMTHGFRALGGWVSPRRGGLLMGLPSTTALVLVGCGLEHGLDEATAAAEACLVGLVAAAALPLAYAAAAAAGWRAHLATAAAAAGYAVVSAGLFWVPKPGTAGCVILAAAGVAGACRLGARVRAGGGGEKGQGRTLSAVERFGCRTAVPAAYVLSVRALSALAGPGLAGRFITFPGGSLAVLVTTHLEAGPATACRMAAAMPTGGLVMLAFLTSFRFGCPGLGLGWGTTAAFATAAATLAVVGSLTGRKAEACANVTTPRKHRRPRVHAAHPGGRCPRSHRDSSRGGRATLGRAWAVGPQVRAPRPARSRFSPKVESLAG